MQKVSEIYKSLYHYTTLDGLLGILQTQTLWATHCRFLNDYSELLVFRDKLIEYVSPIVQEEYRKLIKQSKDAQRVIDQNGGLDRVVQHNTVSIVDAAYGATGVEIYIVSFCGENKNSYNNSNGLLSQWRGYGVWGGISLVFDTHKLEEILQIEAERYSYDFGHFSDVIYSNDETKFKTELSINLTDFTEYVKKMFLHTKLNKQEVPDAIEAFPSFIICTSRYRH